MYIGTQDLLKQYDAYLLEHGYQIEELVNLASDALLNHFTKYNRFAILIGPGNNGADGYSLGLKLEKLGKQVNYYYSGDIGKVSQANRYYRDQCEENHLI
uniref:NAD(P)H-hydrate epimerase n=1 Tax=Catenibacterium sp. TaxID=2049022 RepID=UPI003FD781A7